MAFNIVAALQLQGPTNLRPVISTIENALKGIKANVDINISPAAIANLNNLNRAVLQLQQNLAALNATTSNVASSSAGFTQAMNNTTRATNSAAAAAATGTVNFKGIVDSLNDGSAAAENFGRAAGLAARRYSAFLLAGGAIIALIQGIKSATEEAFEFERELVRLNQVGAGSFAQIRGISDEITRLATNFGVSSKELAQASVVLAQAGYSAEQTKKALEGLAQAALSPNFGNMTQTVEGAVAIIQQFRIGVDQLQGALGSINAVAAGFAVESKDLIEAVKRAGGAFRTTGGDLNEFLAIFTSVRATTRESAEAISTGLRTIFTRLQRQDTVDALQALGVNLRFTRQEAIALGNVNLEQQFVGPYEAVIRLNQALRDVPAGDPRFSQVVEQLGGYRQISRVIPLIQELTTTQKALNVAQYGQFSLQTSANQAQEATIVKVGRLKEEFLALFRTITESKGFKAFIDGTIQLTSALGKLADVLTPLIPLFGALGAIQLGRSLVGFGAGLFTGLSGGVQQAGGNIRRNTGGIVPGVGDTDTIPAMLTPGEYVIRKQAVQAIGVHNLESLNQYAKGGQVKRQRFAEGGLTLSRRELDELRTSIVNNDPNTNDLIRAKTGLTGASLREFKNRFGGEERKFYETKPGLRKDSLNLPFRNDVAGMLTIGDVGDSGVKFIQGKTGLNSANLLAQKAAELAGVQKVTGGVTVHVLSKGASGKFRKEYENKIDGALSSIFPEDSGVKVRLDNNARQTVSGYLFESFISGVAGLRTSGNQETFEFPGNIQNAPRFKELARHSYPDIQPGELLDLKRVTDIRKAGHDIVKKYINYTSADGSFFDNLGVSRKEAQESLALNPGTKRVRKNMGGGIDGGGKVPALLTPGEYIFPAQTVSRLGLGTMHALNAGVQRFAIGGPVLDIQPPGGSVGLAYMDEGKGGGTQTIKYIVDTSRIKAGATQDVLSGKTFTSTRTQERKQVEDAAKQVVNLRVASNVPPANVAATIQNTPALFGLLKYRNFTTPAAIGQINNQATGQSYIDKILAEEESLRPSRKTITAGAAGKPNQVAVPISFFPIVPTARANATQTFNKGVKDAVLLVARNLADAGKPQLQRPNNVSDAIIDSAFTPQGKGRLFEAAVQSVLTPALSTVTNQNFDLAPASHSASNLFGGSIVGKYADIKLTNNQAQVKSVVGKAIRSFADVEEGTAVGTTEKKSLAGLSAAAFNPTSQQFIGGVNTPTYRKLNKGGLVPSLLTPGEFVMGRSAVSKFGTNFFNNINAKRFAFGGPVQRFADGGNVNEYRGTLGLAAATAQIANPAFTMRELEKAQKALAVEANRLGVEINRQTEVILRTNPAGKFESLSISTQKLTDTYNVVAVKTDGATPVLSSLGDLPRRKGRNAPATEAELAAALGAQRNAPVVTLDPDAVPVAAQTPRLAQSAIPPIPYRAWSPGTAGLPVPPPPSWRNTAGIDPDPMAWRGYGPASPGTYDASIAARRAAVPPIPPPAFSFDQLAAAQTKGALAGQLVSDATRQATLAKQQEEIVKQLIAAEEKRLLAEKGVTNAEERRKIAEENVVKALEHGAVINQQRGGGLAIRGIGQVVSNADAARAAFEAQNPGQTYVPPVATAPGGAAVRGALDRASADTTAATNLENMASRIQSATFALSIVSSYGADIIGKIAGRPGTDLSQSGIQRSTYGSAISGGLQGAALGASSGALLGSLSGTPIGTIVGAGAGAVVGGVTGIYTALKDAEKDIRQAKLGKALDDLKVRVDAIINLPPEKFAAGLNPEQSTAIVRRINEAEILSLQKARESSTSFFGGFDEEAFKVQAERGRRESIGQIIAPLSQLLTKQAEVVGKESNIDFKTQEPVALGKSIDELTRRVAGGNAGLNAKIIEELAGARKVSTKDIEADIRKAILASARQESLANENKRVVAESDKLFHAFGRLNQAVDAAASSVASFERVSVTIESLFESKVGGLNFQGIISGGLRNIGSQSSTEFASSTQSFRTLFGETGNTLADTVSALNEVSRELPQVLTQVLRSSPLDPEGGFGVRTRNVLSSRLTGGGQYEQLSGPLKNIVDDAVYRLSSLQNKDIRLQGQANVSLLSERLLEGFNKVADESEKFARKIEAAGNDFVGRLVKNQQSLQRIGQDQDKLVELQTGALRNRATLFAEARGTPNDALSLLTREQLERPIQARQERLTGVAGDAANNPLLIADNLRQVQARLGQAQQEAEKEFRGTGRPGAAKEFIELQQQSANLTLALRNLTNVSERNAAAQEKLSKLQEDRSSRLAFGERFLSGDAASRAQTTRGLALTAVAQQQGSIRQFTDEQRKLIFETLNSLGGARLSGLPGQPLAKDLKEQLVREGGFFDLAPGDKNQMAELNQVIQDNFSKAEAAQEALIAIESGLQEKFYANLIKIQEIFFARLTVERAQDTLTRATIARGALTGEEATQTERERAAGRLNKYGLEEQTDVAKLQLGGSARGQLEDLVKAFEASQEINRKTKDLDVALRNRKDITSDLIDSDKFKLGGIVRPSIVAGRNSFGLPDNSFQEALEKKLIDSGLPGVNAKNAGDITKRFSDLYGEKFGEYLPAGAFSGADAKALFRDTAVPKALDQAIRENILGQRGAAEDRLKTTQTILGDKVSPKFVEKFVADLQSGSTSIDKFTSDLSKFSEKSKIENVADGFFKLQERISPLDDAIREATDNIKAAKLDLEKREKVLPGPGAQFGGLIYRAGGGDAYSPRKGHEIVPNIEAPPGVQRKGTDKVLAVLTPGEYVVRKEQATANLGLLQKINSGRGPVSVDDMLSGDSKLDMVKGTAATGGLIYLQGGGGPVKALNNDEIRFFREHLAKVQLAKQAALADRIKKAVAERKPQAAVDKFGFPVEEDKEFTNFLEALPPEQLSIAYEQSKRLLTQIYALNLARVRGSGGKDLVNKSFDFAADVEGGDKIKVIQRLPPLLKNQLKGYLGIIGNYFTNVDNAPPEQFKSYYMRQIVPIVNLRLRQAQAIANSFDKRINIADKQGNDELFNSLTEGKAEWTNYIEKWSAVPKTKDDINGYNLNNGTDDRLFLNRVVKEAVLPFKPISSREIVLGLRPLVNKADKLIEREQKKEKFGKDKLELTAALARAEELQAKDNLIKFTREMNEQYGEENWVDNPEAVLDNEQYTRYLALNKAINTRQRITKVTALKATAGLKEEEKQNVLNKIQKQAGELGSKQDIADKEAAIILLRDSADKMTGDSVSDKEILQKVVNRRLELEELQRKRTGKAALTDAQKTDRFGLLYEEESSFLTSRRGGAELSNQFTEARNLVNQARLEIEEIKNEKIVNVDPEIIDNLDKQLIPAQDTYNEMVVRLDEIKKQIAQKTGRPLAFNLGGAVPGYGNTDTVPAMLTPGEFVMNRGAAERIGYDNLQHLANGGTVNYQYLAGGGFAGGGFGQRFSQPDLSSSTAGAFAGFAVSANSLSTALTGFAGPAAGLAGALNGFGAIATSLADSLSKIPHTITMEANHNVNVVHNGLEILTALEPSITKMIAAQTNEIIDQFIEQKLPDLGRRV